MKRGWGTAGERLGAAARRAFGTAATLLLVAGLAAAGAKSAREGVDLTRRVRGLDADLARARAENTALREEIRALEGDPVYLEALLRSWRRAGAGERILD
jgi:cell division protein FtsB